jgi:uncharacterized SAM-binding protein YcdF (DUF218 family)
VTARARRRFSIWCAAALALYVAVTFAQVVLAGRQQVASSAEAIVVLGAAQYDGRPSPQLEGRLLTAIDLWNDGSAQYFIVTGGRQEGDRFTEAETSRNVALDNGIPDSNILFEDEGTTTWESLQGVARLVQRYEISSVILVTDPYHAMRASLIAKRSGINVAGVAPVQDSVVNGFVSLRRHLIETAGVAIGRVIGFEQISGRG